jgi:putative colanic acid biosynthesis acetyltransferase WcaF
MLAPMTSAPSPLLGQGNVNPYTTGEHIRRLLWGLVQGSLFRWSPRPLHGWRVALLRLFGASIPDSTGVKIYPTVAIALPWRLTVDAGAVVGPAVRLYSLDRITLRRGATISQHAHLCAGTHDFQRWAMPLVTAPITIGENAWLGADTFVGPGVTIGELCVVGARSVVVKDLPARTVCAGNPCRVLRPREEPV